MFSRELDAHGRAFINYQALAQVEVKDMTIDGFPAKLFFNPARVRSVMADVSPEALQKRACFLCPDGVEEHQLTDFDGNMIPPGVIDHKEWTPDNGRNNALRIHGLGAPRGFYTPMLRTINFPTTKYGEDYAVGLRVSREYQIGRIYDVVYNCRRWDDNSDANCDIVTMNNNHLYKDRIRTWELKARIQMNEGK